MNKEKKKLWVDALKSGRYTQGTRRLRYKNEYCCLGVLCEIAIENGCQLEITEDKSVPGRFKYGGKAGYLPNEVIKWANVCQIDASVLIRMNDSGKSFMEIADYIEENL